MTFDPLSAVIGAILGAAAVVFAAYVLWLRKYP